MTTPEIFIVTEDKFSVQGLPEYFDANDGWVGGYFAEIVVIVLRELDPPLFAYRQKHLPVKTAVGKYSRKIFNVSISRFFYWFLRFIISSYQADSLRCSLSHTACASLLSFSSSRFLIS